MLKGIITIWSGTIANIPAGYVICDGNNGTPDLRNRFIVQPGDTYAVNDTGGNINHNHTFTGDGHTHHVRNFGEWNNATDFDNDTTVDPIIGTTDNGNGLPPYYALAYIMKT